MGDTTSRTSNHDSDDNGITRFFKNLFGDDDDDADKYSRVAGRSQCIVTVHASTNDEAEEAADILDDCGAINVDERAAEYGYNKSGNTSTGSNAGTFDRDDNLTGSDTGRNTYMDTKSDNLSNTTDSNRDYFDKDRNTDETDSLKVVEEDFEVGKKQVDTGRVRLRSRVIERPVEETVRLREEHVTVQRTPVDRDATDAELGNFEEREIEMVERSEVPVVNKQARVVEEVSLNKEVDEREETIRDTVRKTEVDVDENNDVDFDKRRTTDRDRDF